MSCFGILNTAMRVKEVVSTKPKTADQLRIDAMKRQVDTARLQLAKERERQRQQSASKQLQRLQHNNPS